METLIKNIHIISPFLSDAELSKLEFGALQYRKFSRITFKILSYDDHVLKIQTIQGKTPHDNYLTEVELIDRTRDLFCIPFPFHDIIVNAVVFRESQVEKVTPAYIRNCMVDLKIKVKDIVADTGIDKTNISAWISGTRDMSQPVKAMFFYYFKCSSSNFQHEKQPNDNKWKTFNIQPTPDKKVFLKTKDGSIHKVIFGYGLGSRQIYTFEKTPWLGDHNMAELWQEYEN